MYVCGWRWKISTCTEKYGNKSSFQTMKYKIIADVSAQNITSSSGIK